MLLLWGEHRPKFLGASALPPDSVHPFACSAEQIRSDLGLMDFEPGEELPATLFLPTAPGGSPVPSSQLLPLHDETRYPLRKWTVPAIAFEAADALNLLSSFPAELPRGLRLGDSVLFWIEATKFLLDLLTRGRFIPGLEREGNAYSARWHVITRDSKDEDRFSVLAASLPLSAGAAEMSRAPGAEFDSTLLLQAFLERGSDALIRAFLRRSPLLSDQARAEIPSRDVAAAAWLSSLTDPDPEVNAPLHDLLKFEQRIKQWSSSLLSLVKRHPLHVHFSLTPPPAPEKDETWHVHFFLRSKTDPKQIISAPNIWSRDLGFLRQSEYTPEEIEELFLRELGRALHFFPEIRTTLAAETQPASCTLTTEEAYGFLRNSGPLLEQAGYTVAYPDWWQQRGSQLGLTLRVQPPQKARGETHRPSALGMNQLLDYSWNVAVGGRTIAPDDFQQLVHSQKSLVFLDGQWVELHPSKLKATMKFLEKQKKQKGLRLIDALRFGLSIKEDGDILPVQGFESSGWIEQLLNASVQKLQIPEPPASFQGSLRPYQREGLGWLTFLSDINIGGCLADDMGLGKTIQLLALMLLEREEAKQRGETVLPTLLIVPMSILGNWQRESERFAPSLRLHLHHGPNRLNGEAFLREARRADIVLTTYSLAFRDEEMISQVQWGRIALDEAQNIKNLGTKQTRAIRRITFSQMTREDGSSCQRLALTGTPLENHLEELWSIYDFLNGGYLGEIGHFRRRFAVPIERFRDKEASETLARMVKPFLLRRLKSDPSVISDLPEKIEMEEFITLTAEQAALYQSVLDETFPQVETATGIHRKGIVLAAITRLKQICNHPALFLRETQLHADRSGKLSRLDELLETILEEGDRVLLFSQYAQMGQLLRDYLQERFNREALFLHGTLGRPAREKILSQFQDPKGPQIFVLSLKAGGFGLNLTEANQVIHFDQWWNPAVQEQATDRAYRIGQKRSVQVRTFITKGTLEEKIAALLKQKRNLADQIVGTTKNFITEMSTEELRELLSLHTQPPGELQDDENA